MVISKIGHIPYDHIPVINSTLFVTSSAIFDLINTYFDSSMTIICDLLCSLGAS